MSQYKISIIVGSLRKDSINRKFAEALIKLAPQELSFQFIEIGDLPLYNQDDDNNQVMVVKRMKEQIKNSAGLLILTPEYNRSIPGSLKNAIDHGSRPYGQSCWTGKPAGILGVSLGPIGTALAQRDLRAILSHLNVPVLCQPEVFVQVTDDLFDAGGNISAAKKQFFQAWMDQYVAWVAKHSS